MKQFLIKQFIQKLTLLSVVCACFICYPIQIFGKTNEKDSHERIEELDELDFIEMLNSVDPGSGASLIQKFQAKEGKNRLLNGKYNPSGECKVEAFRNKEVLLITIPAHLLFEPNDTELKPGAQDYLSPIKRYLKEPDMFRVMLVMHTDNTGSDEYRDRLTVERVNSVFDWFEDSGVNTRYLFSYALGDEMPLKPNDSMDNRRQNRRLEIYLVPGQKMVEQAQKGRIAF
ncbi:MAG: OmpA family protein [Muribaculaceae bacterium]|nr:OmpA family protein [Muribaculaceae bacterium]